MRIVGELPSLAINMSDQRLLDILRLAQSIPLPASDVPSTGAEPETDINVRDHVLISISV